MPKIRTGRSSKRWGIFRRMILRRSDGAAYLDRRRLIQTPLFGIYLHRFEAPDPGDDLHDHPWPFVTVVLRGGYREVRAPIRSPHLWHWERRRPGRPRVMRLTACHTIRSVEPGTRSLVIVGRRSRDWGFYTPDGYVDHETYDGRRRHLVWQEG